MIKIVFFAALREQLGCNELEISATTAKTVAEVKQVLGEQNNEWQHYLANNSLLCAVNHEMVNDDAPTKAGDEVAFFPPVTGG